MNDHDQPAVTLILDTSALLGFAAGVIDVAETVHEVNANGSRYGVPVPAVVEARAVVPGAERSLLDWLLTQPGCAVLSTWGDDWEELSYWRGVTGRFDAAAAVLAAFEHGCYILASDVKAYPRSEGLPVIYFPA